MFRPVSLFLDLFNRLLIHAFSPLPTPHATPSAYEDSAPLAPPPSPAVPTHSAAAASSALSSSTAIWICQNCQEVNTFRPRDHYYVVFTGTQTGIFRDAYVFLLLSSVSFFHYFSATMSMHWSRASLMAIV